MVLRYRDGNSNNKKGARYTEMEILRTRREHFRVKLESIDNDFNKWL